MPRKTIDPEIYGDLEAHLTRATEDEALFEPENFVAREGAWRSLDQQVVQRLERLIEGADKGAKKRLRGIKREALAIKSRFDQLNQQMYRDFRERLAAGTLTAADIAQQFTAYVERRQDIWDDPPRYDHLDTFVDGVLQIELLPRTQREVEPEMVLYQPTPARIVLNLMRRLDLGPDDVFYDLGSGIGRVTILAALLSPAYVKGVEYEPAYTEYARRHAKDLGLSRIEFINADAREVNYADGTVFFLYTPFKGKVLQRVVELLAYEARSRRIRICTYGPGTFDLMEHGNVVCIDPHPPELHRAAIFEWNYEV